MRGRAGSRARSFHLIDFPLISDIAETEEWTHGHFPHHQGAYMGQPQPQWLYRIDLVNPPFLAAVVEFVGFVGK